MIRALERILSAFVIALFVGVNLSSSGPDSSALADEPKLLELSGDLGTHDPVITKDGDTYYIFYTGGARGGRRGGGRRGNRGGGDNQANDAARGAAARGGEQAGGQPPTHQRAP